MISLQSMLRCLDLAIGRRTDQGEVRLAAEFAFELWRPLPRDAGSVAATGGE